VAKQRNSSAAGEAGRQLWKPVATADVVPDFRGFGRLGRDSEVQEGLITYRTADQPLGPWGPVA
jgi:hypothetical protein